MLALARACGCLYPISFIAIPFTDSSSPPRSLCVGVSPRTPDPSIFPSSHRHLRLSPTPAADERAASGVAVSQSVISQSRRTLRACALLLPGLYHCPRTRDLHAIFISLRRSFDALCPCFCRSNALLPSVAVSLPTNYSALNFTTHPQPNSQCQPQALTGLRAGRQTLLHPRTSLSSTPAYLLLCAPTIEAA